MIATLMTAGGDTANVSQRGPMFASRWSQNEQGSVAQAWLDTGRGFRRTSVSRVRSLAVDAASMGAGVTSSSLWTIRPIERQPRFGRTGRRFATMAGTPRAITGIRPAGYVTTRCRAARRPHGSSHEEHRRFARVTAPRLLRGGTAAAAADGRPIRADDGGAAGYQHGLDRSRVDLGADPRTVDERGFLKVVGATATFAVDAANGAAATIPNASRLAAVEQGAPRPQDSGRHNQQAVDYFVAAGIPRDQVGGVDALTLLAAHGETRSSQQPQPEVIGYQSALKRSIGGVLVADSVAWARLTDRSEVVSEGVYWPALPRAAIADAAEFVRRVNDEQQRQSFLANLPAGLPAGEVVIHHSPATARGEFQAVATYDVAAPVYAPVPAGALAGSSPCHGSDDTSICRDARSDSRRSSRRPGRNAEMQGGDCDATHQIRALDVRPRRRLWRPEMPGTPAVH